MTADRVDCDLLVLGGGMAGMSAAAQAASDGARVIVCERAAHLGGTALLSTGNVWTVATEEAFRQADPDGDVDLWRAVHDDLDPALEWILSLGVEVRERHRSSSSSTYDPPPVGRNVDIAGYMRRGARLVESAGGWLLHGSTVRRLHTDLSNASDLTVTGGSVHNVATGDELAVSSTAVVLASGGFQASPSMRARFLEAVDPEALSVRSNPHSQGAGLSLASEVGAATSDSMDTFYGVIVPAVPGVLSETDFRGLVMHSVVYGLVLGPDGRRLVDESAGAVPVTNAVAKIGHALLVFGPEAQSESLERLGVDLVALAATAAARGARTFVAATLDDLPGALTGWGYNAAAALQTLGEYDAGEFSNLTPSRKRHRWPVGSSEVLVIEVKAAITSSFGGVRTDTNGQVLQNNGKHVTGLYAAGVDQGGYNVSGYVGGLSRALVFGRRAARSAIRHPGARGVDDTPVQ